MNPDTLQMKINTTNKHITNPNSTTRTSPRTSTSPTSNTMSTSTSMITTSTSTMSMRYFTQPGPHKLAHKLVHSRALNRTTAHAHITRAHIRAHTQRTTSHITRAHNSHVKPYTPSHTTHNHAHKLRIHLSHK
eukprot:Phypoly_transcript_20129.p1 GENE.Phypoly_transcript_20129~~Phypoly_transcript_20129.p1  ORF type:complete len:141 (-),score=22.02 Phypoly_transcript_20129:271-669(-)